VTLSTISILLLVISVAVKLWMFSYNRYIGKIINSGINKATAQDSLNDAIATTAVLAGTLIGRFVSFPLMDYGFNHIRTDYVYRIWYCERFGGPASGPVS